MSPDALHTFLKSRFRDAFGEPDHGLGCDSQWSLKPFRGANSINVLISGSRHQAVWVFDPHTPSDPVHRWPVVDHAQVEEIINRILARLDSVVGVQNPSSVNTVSAREQQRWDRGAIELLHAVQRSLLHGSNGRSALSTTARKQRAIRAAAGANAALAHQSTDGDDVINLYEIL